APGASNTPPPPTAPGRRPATAIASRVLPEPPGPVRVTNRVTCEPSSSTSEAVSASRPKKRVNCAGRRGAGCPRGGGAAAGRAGDSSGGGRRAAAGGRALLGRALPPARAPPPRGSAPSPPPPPPTPCSLPP